MSPRFSKCHHRSGSPIDWIREDLAAAGRTIIPTPQGFKTLCPSHNDSNPSMHVSPTKDGAGIMAFCFTCGAKRDALFELLGKSWADYHVNSRPRKTTAAKATSRPEVLISSADQVNVTLRVDQLYETQVQEREAYAQEFAQAKQIDLGVITTATSEGNGSIGIWYVRAGGKYAEANHSVIALNVFRNADGPPCGIQLFKTNGAAFAPRVEGDKPKKRLLLTGSKAGLIFASTSDRQKFFSGTSCIVVESASDLLTAVPYIPQGFVLVALSNGANTLSSQSASPLLDAIASPGRTSVFLAHNDEPGIKQFEKAVVAVTERGGDARFALAAQYVETPAFKASEHSASDPTKGFDLRDLILELKT